MKAKSYAEMSHEELVELVSNMSARFDQTTANLTEANKNIWKLQEELSDVFQALAREKTERDNYFEAFQKTLDIAKALANKVENS